jgi:hypothetical protein
MATSFFSMLEPSLRYSLQTGYPAFIPLLSGFAFGTITLQFFGWILPESSTSTRICSCCTRSTQLLLFVSQYAFDCRDDDIIRFIVIFAL